MLQFTALGRETPDKRDVRARAHDFDEIYAEYAGARAAMQSSRCSQCGVPFCQVHCPLSNNIPDWLKLTAEGRLEEAYETAAATNTFPEICGRICPQDRLCEGNCVLEQSGHGTVTIGAVERYITEHAFEQGWVQPRMPPRELGKSVGIVGAGPAGLAAAERLRAWGYQVHVYDRYDRVGGLLIYGIPNFKLDKSIVQRREELLRRQGIVFHLETEIGRDIPFSDLRMTHDAVLVATGVYRARELSLPGDGLTGIVPALDFLTASNRHGLGEATPGHHLNAHDKNVVVIGGGDTAMDCVRTSIRQGARSVKCLYRRDRDNMPGSRREVIHAEEEGVEFLYLSAPAGFTGDGRVDGVDAQRMHLGLPDATGRATPVVMPGSGFHLPAGLVIKALGFDAEDLHTAFDPELALQSWGTIRVDFPDYAASLPGVFAAGDIVRGASLVVWAIRDGRDAAASIHRFIQSAGGTLQ
jgi:glutamate synthase (NADPH/NADH) small chain